MLHILLLILKWIALILGGIIGLLLLLLLLVLFVPLRYRMRLVSGEEGITGRIQADWLLRAFGITADYRDGKPRVRLKLFWLPLITLYPSKDKGAKRQGRKKQGTRDGSGNVTKEDNWQADKEKIGTADGKRIAAQEDVTQGLTSEQAERARHLSFLPVLFCMYHHNSHFPCLMQLCSYHDSIQLSSYAFILT